MAVSSSRIRCIADRYVAEGMPRRAATKAARRFLEHSDACEEAYVKLVKSYSAKPAQPN